MQNAISQHFLSIGAGFVAIALMFYHLLLS